MSSDLASLHKILNDGTRRKIVLLLNEKSALTYTDLLNAIGGSTGTLNYHLKVLGDLLEKNTDTQYVLSKKGKVASQLLVEFPEPDYSLQAKKKWWKRFWVVAITLDVTGLLLVVYLYGIGLFNSGVMIQGIFSFIGGILFTYFFYRMIRPVTRTINKTSTDNDRAYFHAEVNQELSSMANGSQVDPDRTIKDIFVLSRSDEEVKEQIRNWISEEGITVEAEGEYFFRCRLGVPSGLGLTAPKYFEVSFKTGQDGVSVHTEGWVSIYDIRQVSFSPTARVMAGIPRKKGWKVMSHLWEKLEVMSKK